MENVLYNDLIRRDFDVDVGVVVQNLRDVSGKKIRKQLEVDFVVNRGDERYYIQSALSIADPEKHRQEIASLSRIPDSFRKIVVVKDYIKPWQDEKGIQYIGIEDFLLDDSYIIQIKVRQRRKISCGIRSKNVYPLIQLTKYSQEKIVA